MPLDTSRTPANGMIPSTFPAPDAPVARNSLNVPSNEVFSNILARLPIDPSCRNGEVSKDLFNLRLVSRRVMDAATDVLKAATQQPKCVHCMHRTTALLLRS